jgi:hypothetical protein
MHKIHKHFYDIPQPPTETLLNNVNKRFGYILLTMDIYGIMVQILGRDRFIFSPKRAD